jgi:subfamily B ATP-binding cassette protein MsbA
MKTFLRVLRRLLLYKRQVVLHVFFNLLTISFSLVSLAMVMPFLSLLFDKQKLELTKPVFSLSANWAIAFFNYQVSQTIVQQGKVQALLLVCVVVSVVFFFKNLFLYASKYVMSNIRNGVVRDLRNQTFQKITQLSLAYFSNEKKGDLMTRLTVDVQEVETGIISVLETTIREPLTILTFLAAMFFISPLLTLFVLFVLPMSGFIIGRIGKTLKKKSHLAQQQLGIILSIIDETLSGLRIVKGFNAEKTQSAKFSQQNQNHYDIQMSMMRRRELSSPLSEFLSIVVVCIVLYIGGRMVLSQSTTLTAEAFIGFMLIFSQILNPAKAFTAAYYNIQKGLASVERIEQVLNAPVTVQELPNAKAITGFEQNIEFRDVSFSYGNKMVLQNININLPKGKMLALVGHSGAGKSTLADLLPRFYDPTNGQILIDQTNLTQCKITDLRALMGIVTQEPVLFNDTVFNNIAFGTTDNISPEQVEQAARAANAHDFIVQLPQGYQTNIGDRGTKLSGGERQRLTIARAILKNPPILILDEATSSLDTQSEKLVQDALAKLMQNRTAIVIAHRLSTVQHADEIVVLQQGQIIERGNHHSLMQQANGVYKKLVSLQFVED